MPPFGGIVVLQSTPINVTNPTIHYYNYLHNFMSHEEAERRKDSKFIYIYLRFVIFAFLFIISGCLHLFLWI